MSVAARPLALLVSALAVCLGSTTAPGQDPGRDLPWRRMTPPPTAERAVDLALARIAAGWHWQALQPIRELLLRDEQRALPHLLAALATRAEPNRAARHCYDATRRLDGAAPEEAAVVRAYRDYFGVDGQPELVDARFEAPPPAERAAALQAVLAELPGPLAGRLLQIERSRTTGGEVADVDEARRALLLARQFVARERAMPFEVPGYAALLRAARQDGEHVEVLLERLPRHPQYPERTPVRYATDAELGPYEGLMPATWRPQPAPSYDLPKGLGGRARSAELAGRPRLVVFFLGFGCAHCVAQLADLDPIAREFRAAGIEVVTIGTDSVDQVRAAHQAALENGVDPLHFDVLCDPEGDAFRRWGCWDEFGDEALHGTFFVDGEDRVLWQDVSLRPFEDSRWLLGECRRLLAAWRDA